LIRPPNEGLALTARRHGAPPGDANKDYKARYRTLWFNLKDAANPELRARVLHGELSPHTLVRMTPHELASKVRGATRKGGHSGTRFAAGPSALLRHALPRRTCVRCRSAVGF
jgi:Transcription factor S-II (TFIIS), central domain